jgi:hypothetical protein
LRSKWNQNVQVPTPSLQVREGYLRATVVSVERVLNTAET